MKMLDGMRVYPMVYLRLRSIAPVPRFLTVGFTYRYVPVVVVKVVFWASVYAVSEWTEQLGWSEKNSIISVRAIVPVVPAVMSLKSIFIMNGDVPVSDKKFGCVTDVNCLRGNVARS